METEFSATFTNHPPIHGNSGMNVVQAKRYDLGKSSVTLPQMRIESCGLTVDLSNRSRHWKHRKRFKPKTKSSKKIASGSTNASHLEMRSRGPEPYDVGAQRDRSLSFPPSREEENQTADYVRSMKIGQLPSPSFIDMEEFYRDMMSALAPPNFLPKSFQNKVVGKPNSNTSIPRIPNQSLNIHNHQQQDLFANTDTFQPRSSHEVSILSHLASKRRSEMEEARKLLTSESFPGYSSRENSANISMTQLRRMAEVLKLDERTSMHSIEPIKCTSIPPVSVFFRKRSPKKPKIVLEEYPTDVMTYLNEKVTSSEGTPTEDGTESKMATRDKSDQTQRRKEPKIITRKHSSEKAKDCSTCPLCLTFGKPSKKPLCPPNSPLLD